NKTTGAVLLDKEARQKSVVETIYMTSIYTGSDLFYGPTQCAELLDTAQYPTATIEYTKEVIVAYNLFSIKGDLTIKDVTKPLTLTVTSFFNGPHPMLKKEAIGANATTVIKRSEFNAGKYAPAVSDEVTLDIALEAVAQ